MRMIVANKKRIASVFVGTDFSGADCLGSETWDSPSKPRLLRGGDLVLVTKEGWLGLHDSRFEISVRKVLQRVLVIARWMNQGNYTHDQIGNVTCGTGRPFCFGDEKCEF
jgi:hypothetical protein